jgi:hypothetical protein
MAKFFFSLLTCLFSSTMVESEHEKAANLVFAKVKQHPGRLFSTNLPTGGGDAEDCWVLTGGLEENPLHRGE